MKIIDLRTLKYDLITYKKLMNNPQYIYKLEKCEAIVSDLNITTEATYYSYQLVIHSLNDINFFEATFLIRIKNDDYLKILNKLIYNYDPPKRKEFYKSQIISLKKGN